MNLPLHSTLSTRAGSKSAVKSSKPLTVAVVCVRVCVCVFVRVKNPMADTDGTPLRVIAMRKRNCPVELNAGRALRKHTHFGGP